MIRGVVQRVVRDLENSDEDIATYAAMSVLKLEEIREDELIALAPKLRRATTHGSVSVRFFARKALNEVKLGMRRFPRIAAHYARLRSDTGRASWPDLMADLLLAPTDQKLLVLELLSGIDDPKILPALLLFAGRETDEFVLAEAVRRVGLLGSEDEVPFLKRHLRHKDARVRSNAVEALERIGGQGVVQSILPLLEDEDNRVKATVAKILSRHGEQRVIGVLAGMLRSVEVWMRESAIYALGFVEHREAVDLLLEALVDANPDVRVRAAEGLERLRDPSATEMLQALATASDSQVAAASRRALGAIRRDPANHAYFEADPARRPAAPRRHTPRPGGRRSALTVVEAPPARPATAELPRPSARGESARRQAEELSAARDEMLVEIGHLVLGLWAERQFDRPYLAAFGAEAQKLHYLLAQQKREQSAIAREGRARTFVRFLRESIRFFTREQRVGDRLAALNARLHECHGRLGRRIVDEYLPSDTDLYRLKALLESVQKLEGQIRELESAIGSRG